MTTYPRSKRAKLVLVGGVLASIMAGSACGSNAATTDDEGLTGIVVAEQGTAIVPAGLLPHLADELGYFAEEGLYVEEFISVTKGTDAISGMVSGSVDVSHIGAEGVILASESGGGVVGIGANTDTSQWTVVAAPGIASWDDLKGKTIAVGSTSNITRAMFDKLARAAGLDPETDLTYVGLGDTPQRVAAVQNGQAAATLATFPSAARVISDGMVDLGFTPEGSEVPAMMTTAIEASEEWTKSNPEQVTSYMRALRKTVEHIRDKENEEEVAKIAAELSGEDLDQVKDAIDRYFRDPAMADIFFPADFHHAPGAFDATVDAYIEMGLMTKRITEEEYMDYSFADQAVAK